MAGLKRFVKKVLWDEVSKAAGDTTPSLDVSKVNTLGVFVKVSAATNIQLFVKGNGIYYFYDELSFTAAEHKWWNIWNFPFEEILFKTTAAATITIIVFLKT